MKTIILRKKEMNFSYGFNGEVKDLKGLDRRALGTGIEIVIVNNIKNYKEYELIKYLKTEKEFIDQFNKLFEKSEKLEITEYILKKIDKYKAPKRE